MLPATKTILLIYQNSATKTIGQNQQHINMQKSKLDV